MIRLIAYGLLIYLGYRFLRSMLTLLSGSGTDDSDRGASQEAELIQDPHCGVYFLKQKGVKARIGGRAVYFCSQDCRDGYLVNHRSG